MAKASKTSKASKVPYNAVNQKIWIALVIGLAVGILGTATLIKSQAAGSCPSGSSYSGGHGGGVCIDRESGVIVKTIIN